MERPITFKPETMCLTEKQTDYVCKTVEEGNVINMKTMMFEMVQNQGDNPYKKVVLNKVFREEDKSPEMRNWSIFSDNVRYVKYEQKTPHKLDIDTIDYRHHKESYFKLKKEERKTLDIDFTMYPDILRSKYLDVHEGVYAEMVYTNKFNENSDLSTTYLGQKKMTRDTKINAEERFPIILVKGLPQENCWMTQNVKFCWTQVPQSPTCQSLIICNAKLYMHYQNFLLILRDSSRKWTICQCIICNNSDHRHTWT